MYEFRTHWEHNNHRFLYKRESFGILRMTQKFFIMDFFFHFMYTSWQLSCCKYNCCGNIIHKIVNWRQTRARASCETLMNWLKRKTCRGDWTQETNGMAKNDYLTNVFLSLSLDYAISLKNWMYNKRLIMVCLHKLIEEAYTDISLSISCFPFHYCCCCWFINSLLPLCMPSKS